MIFGLALGSWTLAKVESYIGVVSYHRPHAGYRTECRNTAGVWVGRSSLLTHFRSVKNSRLTRVDGRSARVVAGSEGYELALLDVDAVQNNWFTVSDVLPSAGARLTASAAVRGSGLQTKFGTSLLGIYNKGGRYRFDATAPEYLDPEEQFGIVVDEGNRLAGIVCAFDEGDDDIPPTLEIVPSTLIKAFLDQCRAGTSIGPASLPFKLQAATNRSMRKYLNVDEISEGSLVIGRDEPEVCLAPHGARHYPQVLCGLVFVKLKSQDAMISPD
uniref:Uncharacterized protein n=1 Tax=Rhodosorus marinus TaxID=101924 RepID=A0A7S3ENY0_9RHOD|mmetsp:Transcript_941/g.2387  ORF Transcript_941/g.2387 Transcript_941/m.2387 type:complete len:272 (+) Transcript_941:99-914(+)